MCTVEHGLPVAILSVLTRPNILAAHWAAGVGSVDSRCRDEGSLGRHWVEQALLIEAHAVLAATVARVLVPGASDLGWISAVDLDGLDGDGKHTLRLRQYLQAIAVRWRGAG